MSLVVATNVSSLTAQRALAYADSLQGEAMQRLSTGSKINSASDDAAGLAIAQRMTAQVNGLNMAVKNANDGIALTQSIEGALVEVSDMLQRLRELSVQSANDTNTGTDRRAIQEEVDLLIAEITRVSANTRFNDQLVLDGTFTDRQLQIGSLGGEAIGVSVASVNANALGAYKVTGDIIQAQLGAGAGILANRTEAADDFVLNGRGASKTIDVALKDSAKNVAEKVNALSGETGVSATAKTYGLLSSESDVDVTVSLKINGKSTGEFVISKGNVADAVAKVNLVSGSTGVTASATDENKVRFFAADGSDVLIENTSSDTSLRIQTLGHDGEAAIPQRYWNRATDMANATGGVYAIQSVPSAALITEIDGLTAGDSIAFTFNGKTLSFTAENTGDTAGSISGSGGGAAADATIASLVADIQRHADYASAGFTVSAGTGAIVFTSSTYGEIDTPVSYLTTGNTAVSGTQSTAGVPAPGSDYTDRGAANGAYTLVRRSDGQTYSFNLSASTDGDATAANIETALNAIEGVSGFTVKAKDDAIDTSMIITATTDFGDFDIYKGGDIELDSSRQTFSGIGGVLEWTNSRLTTNPGDYQLQNKTTGETFAFSIPDTDGSTDIDAAELQSALNDIEGVSGFTVHTKPGTAGDTKEAVEFDLGYSSGTDATRVAALGTAAVNGVQTFTIAEINGLLTDAATTVGDVITIAFGPTSDRESITMTVQSGGTATDGKIRMASGGGFTADATSILADLQAQAGHGVDFTSDGTTVTATDNEERGPLAAMTVTSDDAAMAATVSPTVDSTGVAGDTLTFDAGGQSVQLKVIDSALTPISGQVASNATVDDVKTALNTAYTGGLGAFTVTSDFKIKFEYTANGQQADSTGVTLSKAGVSVTTVVTDGNKDADSLVIYGNADFGDFDILSVAGVALSGTAGTTTTLQAGDINLLDVALTAGNTTTDSATVQGSIELSSSDLFTVTQRDEETTTNALTGASDQAPVNSRDATGSLGNDNYFTTRSAQLDSVAAIDLRTQSSASSALAILDGAIEKVSSMRSSLGAIENRLDHTVSNLMNISEQTESARSRIQDADFAAESAKLSKAQVLKQAGVGMLAQANASSQLVLQLLQ